MTTPRLALDTSVAVPLVVETHRQHRPTVEWFGNQSAEPVLAGHAVAETYSVLTRLPGDIRVAPADAARLLHARFGRPLVLDTATAGALPEVLAAAGIAGAAVYDALVALAAKAHGLTLATRDARAAATYARLGVDVRLVAFAPDPG